MLTFAWLILLQVPTTVRFDQPRALAERASSEFRAGRYDRAIADWEAMEKSIQSPGPLLMNLGNAHALAGRLPHAVLAYRRALRDQPEYHNARSNLEFLRQRLGTPDRRQWEADAPLAWPWFVAGFAVQFAFACVVTHQLGRFGIGSGCLAAALLALFVICFAHGLDIESRNEANHLLPIVVISERTIARTGNGPLYPPAPLPPLRAGTEGRLLVDRGDWLLIEFLGRRVGWAPRSAVLIEPMR